MDFCWRTPSPSCSKTATTTCACPSMTSHTPTGGASCWQSTRSETQHDCHPSSLCKTCREPQLLSLHPSHDKSDILQMTPTLKRMNLSIAFVTYFVTLAIWACVLGFSRRSPSTTFGVAARGLSTAPSVWSEAAWRCPSSPAKSASGRWRAKGRSSRSEERPVGKECRSRWSPYH